MSNGDNDDCYDEGSEQKSSYDRISDSFHQLRSFVERGAVPSNRPLLKHAKAVEVNEMIKSICREGR